MGQRTFQPKDTWNLWFYSAQVHSNLLGRWILPPIEFCSNGFCERLTFALKKRQCWWWRWWRWRIRQYFWPFLSGRSRRRKLRLGFRDQQRPCCCCYCCCCCCCCCCTSLPFAQRKYSPKLLRTCQPLLLRESRCKSFDRKTFEQLFSQYIHFYFIYFLLCLYIALPHLAPASISFPLHHNIYPAHPP